MIWITSDTHFLHRRIAAYAKRPANHEDLMWSGLQKVDKTDTLIHCGDVVLGNKVQSQEIIDKIPGQTRILVEGNHDKRGKVRRCIGWDQVYQLGQLYTFWYEGLSICITHRPADLPPTDHDILIHGHIHDIGKQFRSENGRLIVNASVEQWDYNPISLSTIIQIYQDYC